MSQPVEVLYPNSVIKEPDSSHSNGSFGPVFIVLAVIVVVSAVACVVGRLCSRSGQHHRPKEAHHRAKVVSHHHDHPATASKVQSHIGLGPREWESRQKPVINLRERGDDVDLGFDHKRFPSAKIDNNGGGMVMPPPHYNFNGGHKEVKFADNNV